MEEIVNKVALSNIKTIDLEDFYPTQQIIKFDISEHIFEGILLKEKDFRLTLKMLDWSVFKDNGAQIFCSTDAIIPNWAYMLVISYLMPISKLYTIGDSDELEYLFWRNNLNKINLDALKDQAVMVKGCGKKIIPPIAYSIVTELLLPTAKSIFYGEACSNVPIFKKPKIT